MANRGGGYLSLLNNKEIYYIQNPNDEDSIQWAVDLVNEYHKPLREGFNINGQSCYNTKQLNDLDDKKADKDIMKCPNCKSCWEYGKVPGEKEYYIYKGFPSIGKTNYKTCPDCSEWLFNR